MWSHGEAWDVSDGGFALHHSLLCRETRQQTFEHWTSWQLGTPARTHFRSLQVRTHMRMEKQRGVVIAPGSGPPYSSRQAKSERGRNRVSQIPRCVSFRRNWAFEVGVFEGSEFSRSEFSSGQSFRVLRFGEVRGLITEVNAPETCAYCRARKSATSEILIHIFVLSSFSTAHVRATQNELVTSMLTGTCS